MLYLSIFQTQSQYDLLKDRTCDTTVSRMMQLGNDRNEMMTAMKEINSTNAPSIVQVSTIKTFIHLTIGNRTSLFSFLYLQSQKTLFRLLYFFFDKLSIAHLGIRGLVNTHTINAINS